MKNEQLQFELNKLLSDLNVARQNIIHANWFVKGPASIHLCDKYKDYANELTNIIDQIAKRMLQIDFIPLSAIHEFASHSTIKSLKPDGFKTIPVVLDTFIHLTELIADIHVLAIEDEDEVTADLMIKLNSSFEEKIWRLKNEFAKPEAEVQTPEKKG